MKKRSVIRPRDLELLSAYLDGELAPRQVERLRARLQRDAPLRQELESLRATRTLLRGLPAVRAPRNFTLSPEMVHQPRWPRLFPALRLATALAAVALALVVGADLLSMYSMGAPMAMRGAEDAALLAPQDELHKAAGTMSPGIETEAPVVEPESFVPQEDQAAEGVPSFAPAETLPAPRSAIEEGSATPAPVATSTPLPGAGRAAEATPTSAPTLTATPWPTRTPAATATMEVETFGAPVEPAGPPFNWLRVLEIGLGALVVLLAALTFYARRTS